ncbi:P-type conjugative transfer protein TrbJ [Phenylobacterium sp.]|uniref:P-type conjugative transfer protein TrbJ n=1 Tax=Phenylobacterium sp. TaxID=1871053 RepID=UPI002C492925|nr:P-type conjugative transfer protein TrbJ [Phenylobacterium sp.]HVI31051.1 P-type conjugative transfer protein TrbJ [Phenylobacterium sp.]
MRRLVGLALAAALAGTPAGAQLAVYDPANHAQNLLQAARALEQVQHQLASLQNEARNLAALDLKAAGVLDGDLARVNGLLTRAGRLAQEAGALRAQLAAQYPDRVTDASGRAMAEAAETRWKTAVESLRRTLEVQAGVVAGLSATNAQASALARASEGAGGALQAAQAGNQLLAVQSKQLSDLTALLAAQGQAEALERARAAAAAADARARLARFLGQPLP